MIANSVAGAPPPEQRRRQYELKYTIAAARVSAAVSILDKMFDPDPEFPIGTISSIYYDTRDWVSLGEKQNSDYLKRKIRLRWYSDDASSHHTEDRFGFLEVKNRIGSSRTKVRKKTNIPAAVLETLPLNSPELVGVPSQVAGEGVTLPRDLLPMFVVQYQRRRYVERVSGRRICIDFDICAPRVNHSILSNTAPARLDRAVIEAKSHDSNFPRMFRPLATLGLRRTAFSKYGECHAALVPSSF